VLYACVPFPVPGTDAGISYTGPVLLFNFTCKAGGSSPLTLVPQEGDPQQGSHFLDQNLAPVDPELTAAGVTCGGPAVDRPDPEIVAGNVAAAPGETPQPGAPTNTPGGPTATPGGPTATASDSTPTAEATPTETGEDDDDDGGVPVWLWIVIGVAVVAAAGGGLLLWRLRARGAGGDAPGGDTPSAGSDAGPAGDAPSGDPGSA
jgi:hypothetical protein